MQPPWDVNLLTKGSHFGSFTFICAKKSPDTASVLHVCSLLIRPPWCYYKSEFETMTHLCFAGQIIFCDRVGRGNDVVEENPADS